MTAKTIGMIDMLTEKELKVINECLKKGNEVHIKPMKYGAKIVEIQGKVVGKVEAKTE